MVEIRELKSYEVGAKKWKYIAFIPGYKFWEFVNWLNEHDYDFSRTIGYVWFNDPNIAMYLKLNYGN